MGRIENEESVMNSTIKTGEQILPFQLDNSNIRGRIARLDGVLSNVLLQHDYPLEVAGLVAEAAMLTALIGQTIKLRWKLSLQIRGDGPIRIIATDYYGPSKDGEPAHVRAYASFDAEALKEAKGTPFEKIGKGMFALLIDQGEDMTPFQGITPLAGGTLSSCAETYFAQSEQLPTRFEITVGLSTTADEGNNWRGGGIMIQHIPDASPLMAKPDEAGNGDDGLVIASDLLFDEDEENWTRVNMLLDTVEETELAGPLVTPEALLRRLFHEEIVRVFDAQPLEFGCTCGEDAVRSALSIYSAKDIKTMTTDEGRVTADCQFCGAHYDLDPATVGFEAETK